MIDNLKLTIAGTGLSNYNLNILKTLDLELYEKIYFDPVYLKQNENNSILNLIKSKIFAGSVTEIKQDIIMSIKDNIVNKILYLVTGKPTFYSAAPLLIDYLKNEFESFDPHIHLTIIDNESSKDRIINTFGLSEHSIESLSLHGRSEIDLSRLLKNKYTILLSDQQTLSRLYHLLFYLKPEDYTIHMFSKMGYPDEKIFQIDNLKSFIENENISLYDPYTLLIRKNYDDIEQYTSDNDIQHQRGMITKSYKRRLSISELELKPNQVLWDVGAGSGSVGIEAYKLFHVKASFFEKNEDRIPQIEENLKYHKVIGAKLIKGDVIKTHVNQDVLPDRIFIGGGGKEIADNLHLFYEKLKPSGILLINYVTLNYISNTIEYLKENNILHELKAISLTTFKDRGPIFAEPERLMYQFKIWKTDK